MSHSFSMATVTIGSVFSLINFLFSFNIFTLISWISVFGLSFRFLRKEYLIWSGSGVMNMNDDEEIVPFLKPGNTKKKTCKECGQVIKNASTQRPAHICTKLVFYLYIIIIVLIVICIGGTVVAGLVFPAYSLYVSPYLPTSRNMKKYSNTANHTSLELLQDAFVHGNFSTNAMYVPDNYRELLNITLSNGYESFIKCESYIEEARGLLSILSDVQNVVQNKDTLLAALPPIGEILGGLNATFYPYLESLPIQAPLVQDTVEYFKAGNYTYASLSEFVTSHHVFAKDLLQLRVVEIIDIAANPLSLFDAGFVQDMKLIINETRSNVTVIGTDLIEKGTSAFERMSAIIISFLNDEDLAQFEEIPSEFLEVFQLLQEKFVYYKTIIVKLIRVIPNFGQCLMEEGKSRAMEAKKFALQQYASFFRVYWYYTAGLGIVVCLMTYLLVVVCLRGVRMMKETMKYAKSLLQESSESMISELNDLAGDVSKYLCLLQF